MERQKKIDSFKRDPFLAIEHLHGKQLSNALIKRVKDEFFDALHDGSIVRRTKAIRMKPVLGRAVGNFSDFVQGANEEIYAIFKVRGFRKNFLNIMDDYFTADEKQTIEMTDNRGKIKVGVVCFEDDEASEDFALDAAREAASNRSIVSGGSARDPSLRGFRPGALGSDDFDGPG